MPLPYGFNLLLSRFRVLLSFPSNTFLSSCSSIPQPSSVTLISRTHSSCRSCFGNTLPYITILPLRVNFIAFVSKFWMTYYSRLLSKERQGNLFLIYLILHLTVTSLLARVSTLMAKISVMASKIEP